MVSCRCPSSSSTGELLENVKVLDGITRYRIGMNLEMMDPGRSIWPDPRASASVIPDSHQTDVL